MAIVAVAVMAGSCSTKDEVRQKEPVPIRLISSVSVEALTRGADGKVIETDATMTRGIQDEKLANGQTVYVWAKQDGSSSWDYLKAWTLTAGNADGNGYVSLTGSAQYYPLDGTSITMNAVHGNFSSAPTEGTTAIGTLTHSVVADQSSAGNYEKSDLLYGSATGSDADATKNIQFGHKMSKIEVTLTPGHGYSAGDLTSAVVNLNNVQPTITIDPSNGSLGTLSGTVTTITTRKDATSGVYEAVIPPQTLTAAQANTFVSVTLDGLESSARNTVTTFNENTKYVYDVTINVFDPGIPLSTVTAAHLGKVIAANGKVYDTKAIADIHSEGVAMISYVSGTGQGLALSLSDVGNYTWPNAVTAVSSYSKSKPTGTNWVFPSLEQWCRIIDACGGTSYGSETACKQIRYNCGNLRTMMVDCGGDEFGYIYWSSTLCSGYTNVYNNYILYDEAFGGGWWCGSTATDNSRFVRACLTFGY